MADVGMLLMGLSFGGTGWNETPAAVPLTADDGSTALTADDGTTPLTVDA
jgi:hypothetical protein